MTSHLLSLAALHAAAPGVLDVVFGPDGDFEGAPNFVGPLLDTVERRPAYQYVMVTPGLVHDWATMPRIALDLRIPSVYERLRRLCAQALMGRLAGSVVLECGIQPEICLGFVWGMPLQSAFTVWTHDGQCTAGRGPHLPPSPLGQYGAAEFIAALTLALAPRIAALRSTP